MGGLEIIVTQVSNFFISNNKNKHSIRPPAIIITNCSYFLAKTVFFGCFHCSSDIYFKKISTIHIITHTIKHITKMFEIVNNRLKNASIKYILVCSCIEVIMSKLVEWFVTRQTSTDRPVRDQYRQTSTRSAHMYIGWSKTTHYIDFIYYSMLILPFLYFS